MKRNYWLRTSAILQYVQISLAAANVAALKVAEPSLWISAGLFGLQALAIFFSFYFFEAEKRSDEKVK